MLCIKVPFQPLSATSLHRSSAWSLLSLSSSLPLVLLFSLAACGGGQTSPQSSNPSSQAPAVLAAPTVEPLSSSSAPYASVTFSQPQATSFSCQLDQQAAIACSSPWFIAPLSTGQHQLRIYAHQGNQTSDAASLSWQVHSVFPVAGQPNPTADLIPTSVQPSAAAAGSWRGIFRINCDFAHASYQDPIVYFGQGDMAHLHRFYGNTLTDGNSTPQSILSQGDSSCQGNVLNRSAYWLPALLAPSYDLVSGQRLLDSQGAPAWQVVPAVVGNDDEAHEVFYYSAGVDDLQSIQSIPTGLVMIAGSSSATAATPQDTSIVRWHCQSWQSDDSSNPRWSASIPECTVPDRLRLDVFFPSCWNGQTTDAADHKSHMAYPVSSNQGKVCPSSHPVPVLRVSYHYAFAVKPENQDPQTRSSRGWRLASDIGQVDATHAGGYSAHADWMNGWHPEVLQAVLEQCVAKGLDCHDGNLANGYRLSGTRPGSQTEPAIINQGMGMH